MSLNIYTSNRMESLASTLADLLAEPLGSPFTPEQIVVQSKGMQRWLSMTFARRFGVWANCNYPFPNSFVTQLFKLVLPESSSDLLSPDVTTWKLFELLGGTDLDTTYAPLQQYLADDRTAVKRFQLVGRIADIFDQYTLFRPEMLRRWEAGTVASGEEAWQARLWQEIFSGTASGHRGRLKEEFCRLIRANAVDRDIFPERISLFGISYLPAYHLEIIAAVAEITEVNLFLLSPTREYWADIVSKKRMAALSAGERALRVEGNPLLASLGKLGRDFSVMALELGGIATRDEDLYSEPQGDSLLASIQADILNLAGAEEGRVKRPVTEFDRSIQLHSCHSQMREAEVLYDQLLALLEADPSLEPRDILVMTPDIETCAPYITAVFDGMRDNRKKIPFSIADRRLASEGGVASALLKLLALPGSRFTVVQLLDILSMPPVRCRYNLEEDDLVTLRKWLQETGIRWGLDEADRTGLGLPPYRANSWRAGLDRLLLGYAMSDLNDGLFHDILPYDDMEGSVVQLLGSLIDFISAVEKYAALLHGARPLGVWSQVLGSLLKEFICNDSDTSREIAALSGIIEELATLEDKSGFVGAVSFEVIRSWVTNRLGQEEKGVGFMTGGVTFCAMLPMRSIPFRVIAMIGMNDAAFPRQSITQGFDLIAREWQPGDRSLRDEDRYLFLETILSARDSLYISYCGQSMADNSELPPSVLVTELLDAINRGFTAPGDSIEQRLITRHRLQAFSRDYFTDGSRLFSYSEENCAALREKSAGRPVNQLFMPNPLAEPGDDWSDLSLAKLLRFIVNPARFFLENRLGIRLEQSADVLEEREPFAVDHRASYKLKSDLLDLALKGEDPGQLLPGVRSMGILPPALHGDRLFAEHVARVSGFAAEVSAVIGSGAPLPHLDIDLNVGRFRISGRLNQIHPDCMYRYRPATLKAKDLLKCWIEHLLLNAAGVDGYPVETRLMMTGKSVTFARVEDPLAILKPVLELYVQGLTTPLPFFPESALAYAKGKIPWDLGRARVKWEDGYNDIPGEGSDPSFRLCFGKVDPFDAEFERVARILLEPLIQHWKQV